MIRIRTLRKSDFEDIIDIMRNVCLDASNYTTSSLRWRLHYRLRFWKLSTRLKYALKKRSIRYLLAATLDPAVFVAETLKKKVIGLAIVSSMAETVWSLDEIAVHPSYQRQGVGAQLVKAAISYVEDRGGKAIILTVESDNVDAVVFYQGLGFKTLKTIYMGLAIE